MRYRAFISYAHDDERWASWLQSSLERYRIPRRLGRSSELPERLHPVFRDRSDLGSSPDLTESIRAALDDSAALVVICSPAAAGSHWVNEEIRYFLKHHSRERMHCCLVAGNPEREAADCAFPQALLRSEADEPLPEPLAADARPQGDGRRGALLKIVAGLLDIGIDDLKQRDAQRQLRRRGLISAASLVLAVVMLGIAIIAQLAREEADLRRRQAENLISFMLGDLRSGLEPLGRLDLLDSVGDEAMRYFEVLGDRGTEQELFARIMALRQIGEVRFRQGRMASATDSFVESSRLATTLHRAVPSNADYLYQLGQSEFWVGYAALELSDLDRTEVSFRRYMEYSRALTESNPENLEYRKELSYAYSNLGTVLLERQDVDSALSYFLRSVELDEMLSGLRPDNVDDRMDLGNGYSWLGVTYLQLGQLNASQAAYLQAVNTLRALHEREESPLYAENLAQNLYHLGNAFAHTGQVKQATAWFDRSRTILETLVDHDPDNAIWQGDLAAACYFHGALEAAAGNAQAARSLLEMARRRLVSHPNGGTFAAEMLALTESALARLSGSAELAASARARIVGVVEQATATKSRTALAAALVGTTQGQFLRDAGEEAAARAIWSESLALLHRAGDRAPTRLAVERGLLLRLGDRETADRIGAQLEGMGFADPRFSP